MHNLFQARTRAAAAIVVSGVEFKTTIMLLHAFLNFEP